MKKDHTKVKTAPGNKLIVVNPPAEVYEIRRVKGTSKKSKVRIELGTDKKNSLALSRLLLDGTWSLSRNSGLAFKISGTDKTPLRGRTITFQGKLENVSGSEILFHVRRHKTLFGNLTGTIRLTGKWGSDKNNRLVFYVARKKDRYDNLVFNSKWIINRNNQLVCTYTETAQKKRTKKTASIVLKGHWGLKKNRLIYYFEGHPGAYASFKVAFRNTPAKLSGKGVYFETGIKLESSRTSRQTIQRCVLYGNWRLTKDLKCYFELKHTSKSKQRLYFDIEVLRGNNSRLVVQLKQYDVSIPDMKIEFNRIFGDDTELFFALSRKSKDISFVGGIRAVF